MTPQNAVSLEFSEFSDVEEDWPADALVELASFGQLIDYGLVNFLADQDLGLLRLSFTWKADEVLLVLKVRSGEAQQVVFVTRESPTRCIATLLRRLVAGTLPMYPDKFA